MPPPGTIIWMCGWCVIARRERARAAHEFTTLKAGAIHARGLQHQVLRAGLAPHLQATPARSRDLVCDLGAGDVKHLDRLIHQLGEGDRTVRCPPALDDAAPKFLDRLAPTRAVYRAAATTLTSLPRTTINIYDTIQL